MKECGSSVGPGRVRGRPAPDKRLYPAWRSFPPPREFEVRKGNPSSECTSSEWASCESRIPFDFLLEHLLLMHSKLGFPRPHPGPSTRCRD